MNIRTCHNTKKQKNGQSIAEYSIFLAVAAAVLVGVILGPFRNSISGLFGRLMQSIGNGLSIW